MKTKFDFQIWSDTFSTAVIRLPGLLAWVIHVNKHHPLRYTTSVLNLIIMYIYFVAWSNAMSLVYTKIIQEKWYTAVYRNTPIDIFYIGGRGGGGGARGSS